MNTDIIMYSIHDCPHCEKMEEQLESLELNYLRIKNPEAAIEKGFDLVPALEIKGEIYNHEAAVDWVEEKLFYAGKKDRITLGDHWLKDFPSHPAHMSPLGLFTFYRTYSRFLENKGRRETWKETVARAVEYNINLEVHHSREMDIKMDYKNLLQEARDLFVNVFNLKQFPSGRMLFTGGTAAVEKFPMSNFNCSFTNIENWEDLGELFYLLMLGSGVGFKSTPELASKMAPIRINTTLLLSEYRPLPPEQRLEDTEVRFLSNGFAKIYVGDSKEGWRDSLNWYFKILTDSEYENYHTIKISFNSIRERGERLKTFGGTASGPEPLREMFEGFDNVLKNKIDTTLAPIVADGRGYGKARPIHILDMGNLIGNNVVSGGKRYLCPRYIKYFLFRWNSL